LAAIVTLPFQARADGVAMADSGMTLGAYATYDQAVGDFNADGHLDVLTGSANALHLSMNNGDGTFTEAPELTLSGSALGVAAGDLDGDGDLDAYICKIGANEVWINDGTGTLATSGQALGNSNSQGVALGDVDRDGDLDAVVANVNVPNRIWLNNGAGVFGDSGQTLGNDDSRDVALVDVDRDGDLDVVFANSSGHPNRVYLNTGSGTFIDSGQAMGNTYTRSVGVGDLDLDGDVDLFFGDDNNTTNTVWLNNGSGAFDLVPVGYGAWQTHGLRLGDLDNDGDLDAIENNWTQTNQLYVGNRNGTLRYGGYSVGDNGYTYETSSLADLDNDGDLDAYVGVVTAADRVFSNQLIHRSALFPTAYFLTITQQRPYGVAAADFDNDGRLDIVAASQNDDTVAWYRGELTGTGFGASHTLTSAADGAISVAVGDMDRDGLTDILCASENDDRIAWFHNEGSQTFGAMTDINTPDPDGTGPLQGDANGACGVAVGDLDRDGDLDVLSASWTDHKIAWYENTDGAGTFGAQNVIALTATGARCVQVADLDGDGDLDVLFAAYAFDEIGWFENLDGAGTFSTEKDITTDAAMAYYATAADLDGDGDRDVLSASVSDNKIAWYENLDGDGTFGTQNVLTTEATSAQWVHAADLDSDGDNDVLFSAWGSGQVGWFENRDGHADFSAALPFGVPINGARGIVTGDVNQDGSLDVIVTGGQSTSSSAWFVNRGGQIAWDTTSVAPAQVGQGTAAAVLRLDAIHRGRAGDNDALMQGSRLRFESSPNVYLTAEQANALIDSVAVYVDDGSGVYEPGHDIMVVNLTTLTLNSGYLGLPFAGPEANRHVVFGTPTIFHVVVTLTADAASQSPNTFRVTHTPTITDAADAAFGLTLLRELTDPVTTPFVTAVVPPTPVGWMCY